MSDKQRITPEKAVDLLKKHGVIVTLEQAEKILMFMEKFARIAIELYSK